MSLAERLDQSRRAHETSDNPADVEPASDLQTPDVPPAGRELGSEEQQSDPERAEHEIEAHEVLSEFQMYRTDVRQEAGNVLTGVQRTIVEAKNMFSTPKAMVLDYRRDRAQRKYDRISAKQDASRFDFVNRHRDRRAAKAYAKLQHHEANASGHRNMMQARVDKVDNKANERREAIDMRRKQLMAERIKAQERKLIREERRARRQEMAHERSLSHAERERRASSLTPEDMKRIRKAAIASLLLTNQERREAYATA